ncbi:MAG: hypothetical protein NC117_06785 [Pseudoflavonifractor sp.]|nr:hypothetical protein [Pseudoflavonifractor sp.]
MKPAIYHKPPTRERHIVAPNYTYGFARWLKKTTGRTLCPPHRHIIDRLERARLNADPVPDTPRPWRHRPYTPVRIIIADPAPDCTHIPDLLVHYIHWLRSVILPHRRTLILDRTATAARTLVNTLSPFPTTNVGAHQGAPAPTATERRRHPASTAPSRPFATSPTKLHAIGSGCHPATHRGGTFDIILLLNADTYPLSDPRSSHVGMHARASAFCHPDALDIALDTFLPMLQPHRESILIIHGTPYPRPFRRNPPHRRIPRRHPSLTSLNSLNSLTTSSTPPRYNPTPFAHYLNASLNGDLGPFTPIDPESPSRHSQRGSPHTACPSNSSFSERRRRGLIVAPSRAKRGMEKPRHSQTGPRRGPLIPPWSYPSTTADFGDSSYDNRLYRRPLCDSPSDNRLSQRDSNNERTSCFNTGTASIAVTSLGGTSHSDDKRHAIIPLTFAAAAPAA